ncbi:MAG: hypothetical protein ACYDBS_06510, partial [Acidimicrobiales bacterium]
PWVLYRLQSTTLQLHRVGTGSLALSGEPIVSDGLVAGTADTWIGSMGPKSSLIEVDTRSGHVLRQVQTGTFVTSLSLSPDGRLLYVADNRLMRDPVAIPAAVITKRDASNARQLASTGIRFALTGAELGAVGTGVWASYSGGMAGSAVFLAAGNLAPVASTRRLQPAWRLLGGPPVIQGPSLIVRGTQVWLWSAVGLACVAADTGKLQGGALFPIDHGTSPGWTPFAQYNGHLYMTQTVSSNGSTDIVAVKAPRGCS